MNKNIETTFAIGGEQKVNRIGFGAMRLTGQPGNYGPYADWETGKELLQDSVNFGVQFFDSAFAYGPEWADKIIADSLHPYPEDVLIATKGGVTKPAPGKIEIDASPATLRKQIDIALGNLKIDCIDLYQLHRIDPNVPLEDSVGTLEQARQEGKIRFIGLSNVNRDQLDRALTVTPIASVQNRFNQSEREDDDLVDYSNEKGIAYLPWGPLGAQPMEPGAALPATEAISWLLTRSPNIIVIPGTTSKIHLRENCSTWELLQG